MTRRPPRSPLFPCATLFRPRRRPGGVQGGQRLGLLGGGAEVQDREALTVCLDRERRGQPRLADARPPLEDRGAAATGPRRRSEEHTSELQSRQYLGCRLLLE